MKTLASFFAEKFIIHHSSFIILFGLLYVLLIPPFQSPDEPNHFFRAWQVSEGHFSPEKSGARLGGTLPASLSQLSDFFLFLKNDPSARLNFRTWSSALSIPLQPENRRFTDFANTGMYAPTAYLPQALAIAILRPLGATPLQILYAARLANLLVWMALISAALRLMPFMRNTLAAMALLPASLCIAASANADVVTNGLCWWLVAALLSAPEATAFWKKVIVVAMVAANKIIAVPLVLVGYPLPLKGSSWSRSFGQKTRLSSMNSPLGVGGGPRKMHQHHLFAILAATGILAALCWGRLAQGWFIPYDAYDPAFRDTQTLNSGVDPMRQMTFILEHPLFFLKVCSKSLVHALPSLAAHFVGKFGWEKNYLPAGWIVLLWVMLVAMIFSEKNPLTARQRWGMAAVSALYASAFALTMYMLWSAVGSENLDNWQGRYFMPIAPVVVFAIGSGWLEKWKQQINIVTAIILILSNLAMALSVWQRYWAYN